MTLFSLFTRPDTAGEIGAPEAVADRFSWFAFLLSPLYLLVHGLWLALLGFIVAVLVLGLAQRWIGGEAAFWLYVLLALWIGFEAPALRRHRLERRGWIEQKVSFAAGEAQARIDYLRSRTP